MCVTDGKREGDTERELERERQRGKREGMSHDGRDIDHVGVQILSGDRRPTSEPSHLDPVNQS